MKILLAPDSFKDSLSANEVCEALKRGILKALPQAQIVSLPMADGGEGTLETLVGSQKGRTVTSLVNDPLGRPIEAAYGMVGSTAIIEMARASGLELLKPEERNPLKTSTYGTGQLILDALNQGCRHFIIGIGGSATNDGGAGMLQALGVRFLGGDGNEIQVEGGNLDDIARIDNSNLDSRIVQSKIRVACDVTNPLLGENGASHVFAAQKGADKSMIETLEMGLANFSEKTRQIVGQDFSLMPGAGAAGGIGFGLMAYLGAQLRSGFEIVSEWVGLEEEIQKSDLIITGEGKIDEQSRYGKVPSGVAQLAKKHGKPVICIAGQRGNVREIEKDFKGIYSLMKKGENVEYAKNNAARLLEERVLSILLKT